MITSMEVNTDTINNTHQMIYSKLKFEVGVTSSMYSKLSGTKKADSNDDFNTWYLIFNITLLGG